MTVAEAVLWIAFGERQSADFWKRLDPRHALHVADGDPTDAQIEAAQADSAAVDDALADLNTRAQEGRVTVIGQLMNGWEPNPAAVHEAIEADYLRSSAIYLAGQARERDDDVGLITNGPRRRYSGLLLDTAEVMAVWPRGVPRESVNASAQSERPIASTGAPGRPSKSMHLIKPEHARRLHAGEAETALAKEARHLVAWLKNAHPLAPTPTPLTVENQIRDAHRAFTRPTK